MNKSMKSDIYNYSISKYYVLLPKAKTELIKTHETILPLLLFISWLFLRPPFVVVILPAQTARAAPATVL